MQTPNDSSKAPTSTTRSFFSVFKNRKIFFRIIISVILLGFVYSFVDLQALIKTLKIVNPLTALILVLLYTLGQIMSALKWRVFITCAKIERPLLQTIKAYFLGMFANTFGLGTVGGDVSRGLLLNPEPGKRAAALATVVADRVHGLGTLVALGAVSIIFVRPEILEPWAIPLAILVLAGITLGWFWGPSFLEWLIPENHKFGKAVRNASAAFPRSLSKFSIATLISLAFHSLQIFMHYIIAKELGTGLELPYLFAVIPLVNVASALPISIQGLGVREAMYLFVFIPVGVSEEQSVAFGAIWVFTVTIVSALSGLLAGAVLDSPKTSSCSDKG